VPQRLAEFGETVDHGVAVEDDGRVAVDAVLGDVDQARGRPAGNIESWTIDFPKALLHKSSGRFRVSGKPVGQLGLELRDAVDLVKLNGRQRGDVVGSRRPDRPITLDSAVEPRSTRRARRFSKRWLQCCGHLLGEIDGFTKRQLRIVFLRVPSCTSYRVR
jgi:hypothetical protein